MRLVLQLIARLALIVVLCVAAAAAWVTVDAYRSVDRATAASAERVSHALEALYWRELLLHSSRNHEHLLPVPDWRTTETMKLIAPGICIQFQPQAAFEKPLCGQSKGLGEAPPRWFAALVQRLLGDHSAVAQSISARTTTAGTVSAIADPEAAIQLAWQRIQDSFGVALAMALAIGLLASLAIAHALAPARTIVTALQRMAEGEHRPALPRFRSMELAMIGQAVTELGNRLAQATEQRAALTERLLDIRDEERRALARELHDEFGQNLTAILAFASTIETETTPREMRATQDARMITQAVTHLMACLRGTLSRLRRPLAEELGLTAGLVALTENCQHAARPTIRLDLQGDLADIQGPVAVTAYRVAQECLTNALRHTTASEISLKVERRSGPDGALVICIEDDGGGDTAQLSQSKGFGLTGIRERIAAVGGSLSIARAAHGLRVAATIPLAA
ncbi:putative two-component sensor histidine kinase with a Hamp domain [Bradyrhizobium sp. STM 3843]|uniref:sensor histidine kinase n=1 Tax=Bradyrhizobium sp. STM 3843 TaxID=551947 RepID=UPI0002403661|nr:histidine kinase [Bradyrhizobium sp. STM 3843]CCE07774.1 putative two-component sensor histidine kinase with a Hamp domain [Bradyrhizobium sp. STM 3843]